MRGQGSAGFQFYIVAGMSVLYFTFSVALRSLLYLVCIYLLLLTYIYSFLFTRFLLSFVDFCKRKDLGGGGKAGGEVVMGSVFSAPGGGLGRMS